ncbi:uncharacterized protein LOC135370950 [Ornithodoros turicata]|uniref:uncharacterized protein LOC135370950 n=1 Tax=Ornithodoros turicata TaxID=34597 RepID=UPI0031395C39
MRPSVIAVCLLLMGPLHVHGAPLDEGSGPTVDAPTGEAPTDIQANEASNPAVPASPPDTGGTEAPFDPVVTTEQLDSEVPATPNVIVVTPKDPRIPVGGCGIDCDERFPVPVCGSDGQVYHSECVMRQITCGKNVQAVDWEQCRGKHPLCPDKCLDLYDPVCGQDGKFYPNICIMQRRNCGKHLGTQELSVCLTKARESRRIDACPNECPEIYDPVCASNGEVYPNECTLKQETCGQNVLQVPLNQCVQKTKCPKQCLPILDPVCGSDGKRYLNHCRLLESTCGKNVALMPKEFCA